MNDVKKTFGNVKDVKDLALGVAMYSGYSILGPLLIFALVGYVLDRLFETKPAILLICILLAFITTNYLIYKKVKKMIQEINSQATRDLK